MTTLIRIDLIYIYRELPNLELHEKKKQPSTFVGVRAFTEISWDGPRTFPSKYQNLIKMDIGNVWETNWKHFWKQIEK